MTLSRRGFLASATAATAAATLDRTLTPVAAAKSRGLPVLVVVQIEGGWDYLSLLAPTQHPVYQQHRPNLKLATAATLPVQAGFDWRWHPALAPFRDLYDRGDLAVVQNVGYPNPDLSHFESIKKWHAADPTVGALRTGWLGRYLTQAHRGSFHIPALDVEPHPSPVFAGAAVPAVVDIDSLALGFDWSSPEDSAMGRLAIEFNALLGSLSADPVVRGIGGRMVRAFQDAQLLQRAGNGYSPRASYPGTALANHLRVAARFVSVQLPIQVFHVKVSGFDTHSLQAQPGSPATGHLADLLGGVATSIRAFLDDVAAWGRGQDVVVMVYSEFGRRITENGALGTDHGHGGVAFLAGAPVNGGLYGNTPNLDAINQPGQSIYLPFDASSTDYRSLYATVLERWLGVNSVPLLGGTFPLLGAL